MRIEAYNQVQQIYSNTAGTVKDSRKTAAGKAADQVQISSLGKDYQSAKQAVMGSPDVREEKIAPLRASIQKGTYHVNGGSFADKLLEKFEEMR